MADLIVEKREHVALLTLNRPDRPNAITFAMLEALAAMKRLYRNGLGEDFASHTHHVLMQLMLLFRSEDFREGVTSFIERRTPRLEGH